eukprot:scaffold846_cov336-Pavlova_lutheri.AAC.6
MAWHHPHGGSGCDEQGRPFYVAAQVGLPRLGNFVRVPRSFFFDHVSWWTRFQLRPCIAIPS